MSIAEQQPIEGELVPYEPSAPATLFGSDDPQAVIEGARKVARSLKAVLSQQGLTVGISGREHVRVEGWTLLGSMLGVFPVCIWTRKLENGWEARVEARTRTGEIVGAAEAMCTRDEKEWGPNPTRGRPRDEYALRSMAQTRATSKALRLPLGFVVTLAGYEATPAEEGVAEVDGAGEGGSPAPSITDAQNRKIAAQLKELEEKYPKPEGQLPWVEDVRNLIGKRTRKDFTRADASKAIEWLQDQLDGEAIPFG